MFNLTTKEQKDRYREAVNKDMDRLAEIQIKRIRPILGQMYLSAARLLELGVEDVDHVVTNQLYRLTEVETNHYKRVATIFSDKVFKLIEIENERNKNFTCSNIKGVKDDFWAAILPWITREVAKKVVQVGDTTKRLIRIVIQKGLEEGKGLKQVAKELRKIKNITNPVRAERIARTETHTAMTKSFRTAVDSTRLETEREWSSAKDERTRNLDAGDAFDHVVANGERIKKGEMYKRTGESLEYPGDSKGSAANIINCRCVELYHVIRYTNKPQEVVEY